MMIAVVVILVIFYALSQIPSKSKAPTIPTVPLEHFKDTVAELNATIAYLRKDCEFFEKGLQELKSQQQSKSVRLGQISEISIPFHADFPYNPKDLRPLFQPIDYIAFTETEIVFLEMKIGSSKLSEKQKNIRRLIEEKKVRFEEHLVTEKGYTVK